MRSEVLDMALNNIRIGDFIYLIKINCNNPNLSPFDVSGINKDKEFFEPSKQIGKDTSNYKVVPPGCFACNLMHIGRDCVLPIAINRTSKNKIVSPAYTIFKLKENQFLLPEYLFILLNSSEKDRFFWFHCDSSVRDGMNWSSFCDVELQVPSLDIQKKYVAIYESLLANLRSYEKGLDDLKLVCDSYIERLRKNKRTSLKGCLKESDERNELLLAKSEKGVSIQKNFIDTKAKADDIKKQKLVRHGFFAFNSNTSRNSDTISIALNNGEPCAVSATYVVFSCTSKLLPEYLYLWFKRKEFDRFARFNSWGSARETISLKDFEQAEIAIPELNVQKNIIGILSTYEKRKNFVETIKKRVASICPTLIRGSILEERRKGDML